MVHADRWNTNENSLYIKENTMPSSFKNQSKHLNGKIILSCKEFK